MYSFCLVNVPRVYLLKEGDTWHNFFICFILVFSDFVHVVLPLFKFNMWLLTLVCFIRPFVPYNHMDLFSSPTMTLLCWSQSSDSEHCPSLGLTLMTLCWECSRLLHVFLKWQNHIFTTAHKTNADHGFSLERLWSPINPVHPPQHSHSNVHHLCTNSFYS